MSMSMKRVDNLTANLTNCEMTCDALKYTLIGVVLVGLEVLEYVGMRVISIIGACK